MINQNCGCEQTINFPVLSLLSYTQLPLVLCCQIPPPHPTPHLLALIGAVNFLNLPYWVQSGQGKYHFVTNTATH